MHILVTRPEPDASRLAALLAEAGHEASLAPLMQIEFDDESVVSFDQVQAVLITSANGARALARTNGRRNIKMLCVGDASARQAIEDGYDDVTSANGDVEALAALVQQSCNPEDGPLMHVAGGQVAGDLAGALAAEGFEVSRQILYRSAVVDALPEAATRVLRAGTVDGVMLYSPRTANTFATLVKKAQLEGACATLHLLCLSEAVAQAVSGLGCPSVLVADKPTTESMFELLID